MATVTQHIVSIRAERLYREVIAPGGVDFSKFEIDEILEVRAHAQLVATNGEYHERRKALATLIEIEDVLFLRLQS